MTDIDISALEKALFPKSSRPKEELTLKAGISKQELYDKVKRLAGELYIVYNSALRTRDKHSSYVFYRGKDLYIDNRSANIDKIPREALERLYKNAIKKLQPYHQIMDVIIDQNSEIALESNLEGKTGYEIVKFAYDKRCAQITDLICKRVRDFGPIHQMQFEIELTSDKLYKVNLNYWTSTSVATNCDLYPKTIEKAAPLRLFISKFQEVAEQVNAQLDQIQIRR